MAVTLTLLNKRRQNRQLIFEYKMTFSGNYSTGGDTLTIPDQPYGKKPIAAYIAGNADVYILEPYPGSGNSIDGTKDLKVLVRDMSAAGAEIAAAAVPANLVAQKPNLTVVYSAAW